MPTQSTDDAPARERILNAAFSAFVEAGFAQTSTLEIARRARVSKREIYALVGNKQEMLVACIEARAERLRVPADLPEPDDRESLERTLIAFGTQLLRETTDATVVAVFRLAIAEAVHAPEVAETLERLGMRTSRAALTTLLTGAGSRGLLEGRPQELAEQFAGLLWGNVMIGLLLGTIEPPSPREIGRRTRDAVTAFLRLHPAPASDRVDG
ncbi:TetR/AcrR family transcriptional regulator [Flindersiella endophytica]